MKTLTENLKVWRKERNITKADYLVFVGNILEELLEPIYNKCDIEQLKEEMIYNYFDSAEIYQDLNELYVLDAIKDMKVFCINETELMGYDDVKTDNEVFKHINDRRQNPFQKKQWEKLGSSGKWEKDRTQPQDEIYQPDYEICKL